MGTHRDEADRFYDQDNVVDGIRYRVDNSKPNHFHDDALGDPYSCTGDHNHPEKVGMTPGKAVAIMGVYSALAFLAGFAFSRLVF